MNRVLASLVVVSLVGCTGSILEGQSADGPGPSGAGGAGATTPAGGNTGTGAGEQPEAPCNGACVALSPIAAITRLEYQNAARDVFGLTNVRLDGLPIDGAFDQFATNASSARSNDDATSYETVATETVEAAKTQLATQCTSANAVNAYVRTKAALLFRRPLTDAEVAEYRALYDAEVTAGSAHVDALAAVVSALLQEPTFLYKVEASAADAQTAVRALNAYELAGRLAAFLWRSVPDQVLLDAASLGALDTDQGVATQVTRMMADPKFDRALTAFHESWLGAVSVSPNAGLDAALVADLREELSRFIKQVLRSPEPTLEHLFTEPAAPLSSRLATHFGVAAPASEWSATTIPGRAGLLGRALPIIANSGGSASTRSVYRGLMVYKRMLCRSVGAPPAEALDFARHFQRQPEWNDKQFITHLTLETQGCSGCHRAFGPLGFAFERFDMQGRLTANADTTGTFDGAAFDGPTQLQQQLLGEELESCVTRKWLTFALGRNAEEADLHGAREGTQALKTGTGKLNLVELVKTVPTLEAFRLRRFDFDAGTPAVVDAGSTMAIDAGTTLAPCQYEEHFSSGVGRWYAYNEGVVTTEAGVGVLTLHSSIWAGAGAGLNENWGTQPRWVRLTILPGSLTSVTLRLGDSPMVQLDGVGPHRVLLHPTTGGDLFVNAVNAAPNTALKFDDVCIEAP